jgi:hypothetical protein
VCRAWPSGLAKTPRAVSRSDGPAQHQERARFGFQFD